METTIATITAGATSALTFVLDSASAVFDFMMGNPLISLGVFVGVGMIGVRVIKKFI